MGLTDTLAQMLAANPNLFKRKNEESTGVPFQRFPMDEMPNLPPRPPMDMMDRTQLPLIPTQPSPVTPIGATPNLARPIPTLQPDDDIPSNSVRQPTFTGAPTNDPNASSSTANPDLPLPERDRLDAKANELRALISDPARKNDPLNKIPWWKRLLEGAFAGVQGAGQMAQQAMARGQNLSLGGVLGGIGAGAAAGLAMPKGVADYRHRRELAGIQDQQGDIYEQQKRKDEEAQRILNRDLTKSQIEENRAQAAKNANGEEEDWQPWDGAGGRVFWKTKGGKMKPMIDPDTKKQMVKEDYVTVIGSDNISRTFNRHTGRELFAHDRPAQEDEIEKTNRIAREGYDKDVGKANAEISKISSTLRSKRRDFDLKKTELERLEKQASDFKQPEVPNGIISQQRSAVNKLQDEIGVLEGELDGAHTARDSIKEPVKAQGMGTAPKFDRDAAKKKLMEKNPGMTSKEADAIMNKK